jgi:hypothetical protein
VLDPWYAFSRKFSYTFFAEIMSAGAYTRVARSY